MWLLQLCLFFRINEIQQRLQKQVTLSKISYIAMLQCKFGDGLILGNLYQVHLVQILQTFGEFLPGYARTNFLQRICHDLIAFLHGCFISTFQNNSQTNTCVAPSLRLKCFFCTEFVSLHKFTALLTY